VSLRLARFPEWEIIERRLPFLGSEAWFFIFVTFLFKNLPLAMNVLVFHAVSFSFLKESLAFPGRDFVPPLP